MTPEKAFEEAWEKYPLYKRMWVSIFHTESFKLAKMAFIMGASWQRGQP
jgi:hypothetical protein